MGLTARLGALGAIAAATPAMAQQQQGGYYGHPHMWDGGGWWMFLGPLWMILIIVLVIVGAAYLVRWLGGSTAGPISPTGPGQTAPNQALEILKQRFARGEIDKEEFEERRRLLE